LAGLRGRLLALRREFAGIHDLELFQWDFLLFLLYYLNLGLFLLFYEVKVSINNFGLLDWLLDWFVILFGERETSFF
jgi:hypothetical protein